MQELAGGECLHRFKARCMQVKIGNTETNICTIMLGKLLFAANYTGTLSLVIMINIFFEQARENWRELEHEQRWFMFFPPRHPLHACTVLPSDLKGRKGARQLNDSDQTPWCKCSWYCVVSLARPSKSTRYIEAPIVVNYVPDLSSD